MNSSPPRTNSAPSQMTSILASARLYSPMPPAHPQYHQFPRGACHVGGHDRRRPRSFMDAHEIVVHRKQRDRMRVVFDLLAECVGEPSNQAGEKAGALAAFADDKDEVTAG